MNSNNQAAANLLAYREHAKNASLPIFSKPWWLDAACGPDGWDVALFQNGQEVIASLPYPTSHRFGLTISRMPMLTQALGPTIHYPPDQRIQKRLSFEKEIIDSLAGDLEHLAHFAQTFSPEIANWLPFYWQGFSQTTRYTYQLDAIKDHDAIWAGMSGNIRREIRKAEKTLRVVPCADPDTIYALVKKTFLRQGQEPPYTEAYFRKLVEASVANGSCEMLTAIDDEGAQHAGMLIVWDDNVAYYLAGGSDPDLRTSGAMSMVMWHAIKRASVEVDRFDFEGSMIESVERFFRSFGAHQRLLFRISKTTHPILRAGFAARTLAKR